LHAVFDAEGAHAVQGPDNQPVQARTAGEVYRFGPFELDAVHRRLLCEGSPVALPDRHINLLAVLASHAGQIVSKQSLIESVWGIAVTDNSIERGIWNLRRALGQQPSGAPYIETPGRG